MSYTPAEKHLYVRPRYTLALRNPLNAIRTGALFENLAGPRYDPRYLGNITISRSISSRILANKEEKEGSKYSLWSLICSA